MLYLTLLACGPKDDDSKPNDDPGSATDDSGSVITDDSGTTSATQDFGLESRPSNKTCVPPDRPTTEVDATWETVFPALSIDSAVQLVHPPDDDGTLYVVEQRGRVHAFENRNDVKSASEVLDITSMVYTSYESGLLSIAFHPDFSSTTGGEVFLSFNTREKGQYYSLVTRIHSDGAGQPFDLKTGEVVLRVPQPADNHQGGQLAFGFDGMLYLSLGDGGGGWDTYNNGQNPFTLLGTIVRIDVDGAKPYAIPSDNPYADGADGAPEVWAWGLRNPWRFSFDPATGDLWAGDVGQNEYEEVDLIEPGGNYGWPIFEGFSCVSPPCATGMLDPVVDYDPGGNSSVVMGPVYRGSTLDGLVGTPLFTDFFDGELRGIVWDEATGEASIRTVVPATSQFMGGFGTDLDGNVYALDYYGGSIQKLVANTATKTTPFPALLSETGCVDVNDPSVPASGLIPFDPVAPFWSDGAEKDRWLAIPDGTTITVEADGDFGFPVGTVLMKHFTLADALFETRLFFRHEDGDWGGYTYAWREDGSNADWVPAGSVVEVAGQTWTYPTSAQCLSCHTQAAGGALGPEASQLDHPMTYDATGWTANQLDTLRHIGVVDESTVESTPLVAPLGKGDLSERARSYLHSNCSGCHRPDGGGGGALDLRVGTALKDTKLCEAPESGDLGVKDARLANPADVDNSIVLLRMASREAEGMPPIGSHQIDTEGVALVRGWIQDALICP